MAPAISTTPLTFSYEDAFDMSQRTMIVLGWLILHGAFSRTAYESLEISEDHDVYSLTGLLYSSSERVTICTFTKVIADGYERREAVSAAQELVRLVLELKQEISLSSMWMRRDYLNQLSRYVERYSLTEAEIGLSS
jgi:hypothetical protein